MIVSWGTYNVAGERIKFTTETAVNDDVKSVSADLPTQGKLRVTFAGQFGTQTLARETEGGQAQRTEPRQPAEQPGAAAEDAVDPRALVGVWTTNAQVGQVTLALQADGNFIMEMTSPYAAMPARYYGSYTLQGSKLTLKYGGGMMPDDTSIIHMPNPNLLVAKGITGLSLEYRRVQ